MIVHGCRGCRSRYYAAAHNDSSVPRDAPGDSVQTAENVVVVVERELYLPQHEQKYNATQLKIHKSSGRLPE